MNTIFLLRQVLRVGLCACVFGCSQRTVMDSQCVESPDPHADDAESITGNDATAHEGSDSGDDDSASESQPDSADNLPADTDTKEDTGVVGSDPDTTGDTAPPVDSEPPAPCAPPDGFDAVAVDYSFMGRGNDTLAEAIRAIRSSTGEMYDIQLIFAAQSDWNARTGGIALPDMDWSTHGLVLAMAVSTGGGHTFHAKPVFFNDGQGEQILHLFITAPYAGDIDTDCAVTDGFAIVVPLPDLPDTASLVEHVRCDPGASAYEILPCMNQMGWP